MTPQRHLNRLWRGVGQPQHDGPVHVSMNDYWIHRWRDVPGVARAGMRLRRSWPDIEGALGLWFAASSGARDARYQCHSGDRTMTCVVSSSLPNTCAS